MVYKMENGEVSPYKSKETKTTEKVNVTSDLADENNDAILELANYISQQDTYIAELEERIRRLENG